jgi:DNA-binding transcriptional LysR family regulator
MELSSQYAYRVYREKSFSAAAKSLFVSQPALSTCIARLEKELGFLIFDRSTVPISLTAAGKIYIDSLEEIMESERHMRRRIRQLSDTKKDRLSIGGNSNAAYCMLPVLCREFVRQYPDISLQLDMGSSRDSTRMYDALKQQNFDLLFSYGYEPELHRAVPLTRERLIIAMHKDLAKNENLHRFALSYDEVTNQSYDPDKEIEDLSIFKDIPFFRFKKGSLSYQEMAHMLGDTVTASPHTINHMTNSRMHYDMMCAGLAAVLISAFMVKTSAMRTDDVLYFVPKLPQSYRNVYLLSDINTPQSPAALAFIEVAKQVCGSDKLTSLWR